MRRYSSSARREFPDRSLWKRLLAVVLLIGVAIVFTPNGAEASGSGPSSISISAVSLNYALPPVLPGAKNTLSKPGKNEPGEKTVLLPHGLPSVSAWRHFILGAPLLNCIGNLGSGIFGTFGKYFRQACLYLYLPPPHRMVSSETH